MRDHRGFRIEVRCVNRKRGEIEEIPYQKPQAKILAPTKRVALEEAVRLETAPTSGTSLTTVHEPHVNLIGHRHCRRPRLSNSHRQDSAGSLGRRSPAG